MSADDLGLPPGSWRYNPRTLRQEYHATPPPPRPRCERCLEPIPPRGKRFCSLPCWRLYEQEAA